MQWLLVLVVLWGAVLIPPWIADRRRDRPVQTMASFSRRLQQLEQLEHAPYASPALARDAYGGGVGVVTGYGDDYTDHGDDFGDVEAYDDGLDVDDLDDLDELDRLELEPVDHPFGRYDRRARRSRHDHHDRYDHHAEAPARADAAVSRTALRRRRQVFFFLLAAVAGTLGALLALRTATAVYVHVGALVLFTTYVTLLVRHHQRATERASKVRYLSPIRAPRPAVVVLRSGTAR
ncbi:MAG TPA: hypothetical protein VIL36_09510 [Acidimicrobiales bacterium]